MTDPSAELEALDALQSSINKLASSVGSSFPLNKRETFAAFIMMGLASRLQPLHTDSPAHQTKVVKLSFAMADQALGECGEE